MQIATLDLFANTACAAFLAILAPPCVPVAEVVLVAFTIPALDPTMAPSTPGAGQVVLAIGEVAVAD